MTTQKVKILKLNKYIQNDILVCPLRKLDIIKVMNWRNSQIKYLRQTKIITKKEQVKYYNQVVLKGHLNNKPKQILFSILKDNDCIGYGGLVHIDWENKNSEISFLLKPELYSNENKYLGYFDDFLVIIEKISRQIELHKIYTFGYDIGKYRFEPLKKRHFVLEVKLKDHVFIEKKNRDVLIYSKIMSNGNKTR